MEGGTWNDVARDCPLRRFNIEETERTRYAQVFPPLHVTILVSVGG